MKVNPIVWWELASHNAEKTADFLTGLLVTFLHQGIRKKIQANQRGKKRGKNNLFILGELGDRAIFFALFFI